MKISFKRKSVTVLIVLGSMVLMSILFLSYRSTLSVIEGSGLIEHTQQILLESDQLAMDVKDIQVNGRVYLVTRNDSFLQQVSLKEKSASAHLQKLRTLVSDNPSQVERADTLKRLLARHTNVSALILASAKHDSVASASALNLFLESKLFEDEFHKTINEFQEEEYRLLSLRKTTSHNSVTRLEWFFGGLTFTFVVLLGIIMGSVRQGGILKAKLTEHNVNLEKTLKEVTEYKYALDESAIVAITDPRGMIKHVNDNFCKISKYDRDELIGKDHRIINSGYHSKEFIRNIWQTISSGNVWKGELRNRAKDGSIYWVYTSIVPFLNETGKPYQYLAIRSDITERKVADEIKSANIRLEIEIQEKKAELSDVLEKMKDGFVMLDNDLIYRYVNRKFSELAQKDAEKIIGRYIWDEFPDVVGSSTYNAINDALRERKYICHMDYYPPLDVWHENNIYPTPTGLSIVIRDVTAEMRAERKLLESERLYRMIASSIPGTVICLVDTDYRYLLVEGDMLEKVGYSREGLLGKKAIDVLPGERYNAIEPLFKRVFAGETFSVEIRRGNYDFLLRHVPLKNERDEIYAAMIVSIDVTDVKDAEREVAELNADLEKRITERTAQLEVANKELESFSYSVAHDLRAPLRGVAGYASMLSEDHKDNLDEEGERLLREIEYNAGKMGTLIDDLLTFSRLGRKEVRRGEVDMEGLISDVLNDLKKGLAEIIVKDIKPVYGDFALLKHVLTNLLSNAVKYSATRSHPVIRVSSCEREGKIIYSVSDNGVGFDMQYANELFGVFQRLHSSEEFEGTGVGLAIVKRIITRHGGEVWADAKEGHGATFYFTIPVVPAEQKK
jgi:PAS domain S-box-containing protein